MEGKLMPCYETRPVPKELPDGRKTRWKKQKELNPKKRIEEVSTGKESRPSYQNTDDAVEISMNALANTPFEKTQKPKAPQTLRAKPAQKKNEIIKFNFKDNEIKLHSIIYAISIIASCLLAFDSNYGFTKSIYQLIVVVIAIGLIEVIMGYTVFYTKGKKQIVSIIGCILLGMSVTATKDISATGSGLTKYAIATFKIINLQGGISSNESKAEVAILDGNPKIQNQEEDWANLKRDKIHKILTGLEANLINIGEIWNIAVLRIIILLGALTSLFNLKKRSLVI
jgi:hypothetical protein